MRVKYMLKPPVLKLMGFNFGWIMSKMNTSEINELTGSMA